MSARARARNVRPAVEEVRRPPCNIEAERCVLGSMIRLNDCIEDVLQELNRGCFYLDAHQKIFAAAVDLRDSGKPVDLVTLAEELMRRKEIENVGGPAYIGELWDAAPHAGNAIYYCRIVKDDFLSRSLAHAASEILRVVHDRSAPAEEQLDEAERAILNIGDSCLKGTTCDLGVTLQEAFVRIDERKNGRQCGVKMGFCGLDDMALLHEAELTLVAARPSHGKTSFALAVLRHILVHELKTALFVSLEQTRMDVAERLLSIQSGVPVYDMRRGSMTAEQNGKLIQANDELRRGAQVFIDDNPFQTVARITSNARRLKVRSNIGIIFVDYLQLVEPESRREPRHEQVAQISRRLKGLARELALPVVVLAQLNRELESRPDHEPRLSDLRETGELEQNADMVLLLNRPELYSGASAEFSGLATVKIAKQRNGPVGTLILRYVPECMRFEDQARLKQNVPFG